MNKAFFIISVSLKIIAFNSELDLCQDFNFDKVGIIDTDDLADYCRVLSTLLNKIRCCYAEENEKIYCREIPDDELLTILRDLKNLRKILLSITK